MTAPIKILIVEDHELTRQGLSYGLKKHAGFAVLPEAENGQEAVALANTHQPNIILMDIVLPVLNGVEATKAIKAANPDIKILMLTSHNDREKVFEAFSAGADGYCMKDVRTERLIQVIEMVCEGVLWLDPSIANYILQVLPLVSESLVRAEEKNLKTVGLTAREEETLKLIVEGLTNKDISERLCISLFTVKNHVSSIIQKFAVEDRTQVAILALKRGLF